MVLAGCGGPSDAANEAYAADNEGCQMTPRELTVEEMAAIDLVSSEKDIGYAFFNYHFDDSYEGMNVRMRIYQNGEPQEHDPLIFGVQFHNEDSRDGTMAVVMEETGFRVKTRDNNGGLSYGEKDAKDIIQIADQGAGSFAAREGEKDAEGHMILYTASIFKKGIEEFAPPDLEIEEGRKTFDIVAEVYAEGY